MRLLTRFVMCYDYFFFLITFFALSINSLVYKKRLIYEKVYVCCLWTKCLRNHLLQKTVIFYDVHWTTTYNNAFALKRNDNDDDNDDDKERGDEVMR